jgi:hypothetical protein
MSLFGVELELISVSVKVDVTAKLVEVASIPDIQRKSGEQLEEFCAYQVICLNLAS